MNRLDFFPKELESLFSPKKVLGAGSMGTVYLAVEVASGALVALKVLPFCQEESASRRLEREAMTLKRFRHPNVLRVFAFGETENGPYLVSEYLRGATLDEVVGPQDVAQIGYQVALGLTAVHKENLLHRDVKPANIFITNKGRVVLMDFGLVYDPGFSRLTNTGGMVGTMNYMAPEVMRGEPALAASDWYSWGATLFYLCEGEVPHSRVDLIRALASETELVPEFKKQDANSPIARVIRQALDWHPEKRPKSAEEIGVVLNLI